MKDKVKTDADRLVIWVIASNLSDGSEAFAVEINNQKFDCITEEDAEELANGIVDLIETHTNCEATVMRS